MPTLKQLTCSLKHADSAKAFKEYYVSYEDGIVTCYCLLPSTWVQLSIILKSEGYIAPGLAMFVYIDGVYQTNRSRRDLRLPAQGQSMTCAEVNFKVSQKESFKPDGEIVATKWILYPLMHRSHEQSTVDPKTADEWKQLSTIEVRVLRCEGDTKHDPSSIFGSIPPPDMPRVATKYGQWKYHPFGGLNRNANQSGKSPAGNFTPTVTKTGSNTLSTFDMQRLHNFIPQHSNTVPFNQHAGSSDQLHSSKSELAFNWSSESYRNLQTQLENAYNVIDAENPEKQHSHINIKYRGREYRHTVATPKYIDTLDKPYARFLFQYRDKDKLEFCTGKRLDTSMEDAEAEFATKTKDQVIAELVAQRKRFDDLSSGHNPTADTPVVEWTVPVQDAAGRAASTTEWKPSTNNEHYSTDHYKGDNSSGQKFDDTFQDNTAGSHHNNPHADNWSHNDMTTKNTPEQALDTIFDGQNISQESSGANYENPNKWDSNNESPAFNSFDLELLGPRPASPTTSWVGRPGLSMAEMEANFEAGKTTRRAQSKWDENSARIKSATPDINEAKNNTTAVDAWGDEVGSRQGSAGFGARSGNAGDHQASQPMPMTHFQVEYVRLHDVGSNSGQAAAGDDW